MKIIMLVAVTILLIGLTSLAREIGDQKKAINGLEISVSPEKDFFYLNGPIGILLTVQNNLKYSIELDMSYPDLMPQQFIPKGEGVLKKVINQPVYLDYKYVPIKVQTDDSYKAVIYLNRHWEFQKAGAFDVEYNISIQWERLDDEKGSKASFQTATKKGILRLIIKEADEKILDKELGLVSKGLSSKDRQKQLEAMEALCHLDTPLCIKYLGQALSVEFLEERAIKALARFKGQEAETLIESALTNRDPPTVKAALDALAERGKLLDDEKIKSLFKDRHYKYSTIEYLSKMGNAKHITMLESLLNDENPLIAEAARKCIEQLKDRK
jgi:hypothetical protein